MGQHLIADRDAQSNESRLRLSYDELALALVSWQGFRQASAKWAAVIAHATDWPGRARKLPLCPNHHLIIEDDRALVEVLAYNLRQAGDEVDAAYDGMDGLTQAQLKPPDFVVLDLMLPVMDGIEVCRRLRSDPHTSDTLVPLRVRDPSSKEEDASDS